MRAGGRCCGDTHEGVIIMFVMSNVPGCLAPSTPSLDLAPSNLSLEWSLSLG